jgi:phosphoribosylcarboxyaminoimidazole (NCAIR) mutase
MQPLVGVIMGSKSDWETMRHAVETIGKAGAINAALLATAILANKYPQYRDALRAYRQRQTQAVLENPDPRKVGVR